MKAVIFDYNRTLFDPESNRLYSGAVDVLEKLKGRFRLALVAKGDAARLKQIEELGLVKYFKCIVVNKEKGLDDYKRTMATLGVEPGEAYVVGDRVAEEIRMGNTLGAVTVWLRNGKFKDELPKDKNELPAYTIEDLKNLLELLK